MFDVLLGGMVGVASGMRHAMEPDHLAAVSTFAVRERTPVGAMRFAAAWGVGHALMLLAVSGTLIVTRSELPFVVGQMFEVAVAVMLVLLGLRAIAQRPDLVPHAHANGVVHAGHDHEPRDAGVNGLVRPLVVGVVHGLAGSGALTALTLATVGSATAGVAYVALYGFGAMVGMALLAGIAGAPLARLAKSTLAMRSLTVATGLVSVGVGIAWGAEAARHLVG